MSGPRARKDRSERAEGWYVYGIVEADVEVLPDSRGVGDPPAPIEVVRSGDVAALVSRIDVDAPLGTSGDLIAHEEILDATAADVPVLPMRFGAVVASRDAVVNELLEPYEQEFADALHELTDEVQLVVRARYDEETLMRSVLDENPSVARLREQLGDPDDPTNHDARVRLGELVSQAVEAKRQADTQAVADAIADVAIAMSMRQPAHELDAAHIAVLVDVGQRARLEKALSRVAKDWRGRAQVSLHGPMAPYDFVVTAQA
jgi:hypothetical protein